MLSVNSPKRVARASTVLTNAAVGTTPLSVGATLDGFVGVQINFTIGSLSNGIFNPQVSNDGATWYDVTKPGLLTLTASGNKAFAVNCNGFKLFRVAVTGTGTVTSSLAAIWYGYLIDGGARAE